MSNQSDTTWLRRHLLVVGTALIVAAVVIVTAGLLWVRHRQDQENRADAAARTEVLAAGRQEIAAMTNVDYRDLNGTRRRWLGASTGLLYQSVAKGGAQLMKQLLLAQVVSSGTITTASVPAVDRDAGTAGLTADVIVQMALHGKPVSKTTNRIVATLQKTSAGWKLTAMTGGPVVGK
jgi:Mce-associated membrane protein